MNTNLPEAITRSLTGILGRVRRLQWARGLLAVATLALAALLATMGADYFLAPLPGAARWVLWSAFLALTAWGAFHFLWRPLSRRPGLVRIARWIEDKHPELQERLSTVLELQGDTHGGSEELLAELAVAAEADAQGLNASREVRTRRVRVWLWPALALAAALVALFAVWPRETGRLFVRAVAPFSQIGNAGAVSFRIEPGDLEVMEGEAVVLHAFYQGPRDTMTLVSTTDDGKVLREELRSGGSSGGTTEFTYELAAAKLSFRYHLEAGRAQSDSHRVTVWPVPRLAQATAAYTYPAYSGLAPARRDAQPEIKALAGTQVVIEGNPNTPVVSGRFLVDGRETGSVKIEPGASGGRVLVDLTMARDLSGLGQILLTHRLGREAEAFRVPVQSLPDEAPVVTIISPAGREFEVQPDEELTIDYDVVEELGLQGAEVDLQANNRTLEPLRLDLPVRVPGSRIPRWRGQAIVSVARILEKMRDANQVELRLRLKDTCPPDLGGPGVGFSETITLRIRRDAPSLVRQEVESATNDARKTTDKTLQNLWEAKGRIEAAKEEMKKPEPGEWARKQMEEAREKLAQAQESLEKLAERMDNNVHAAKADEARQAAESAEKARESAEKAPLQETPEARGQEMAEAQKQAEQAIKQTEALRQQIEQSRQATEEVARLADLARQERELARQADPNRQENDQQNAQPEAKPSDDWRNRQRQVENNIQEQARQSPEAMQDVARQQAEQARELAQQARDLAQDQKQLGETARNTPQPNQQNNQNAQPDAKSLMKELAREQQQIAGEAAQQMNEARENQEHRADRMPEAVAEAKQAAQEAQADQAAPAAESAQKAANTMKELAQAGQPEKPESGSPESGQPENGRKPDAADPALGRLAERQQKVAEAMKAVAEGRTAEAMAQAEQAQSAQVADLAREIAAMPETREASGEMGQANAQSQQANDHAREAANQAAQKNSPAVAERNANASNALEQTAQALDQAAEKLGAQAQAKAQPPPPNNGQQTPAAAADPSAMAEAVEQSAQATEAPSRSEAAESAQNAAQALAQAARAAMDNLRSGQQPGMAGQPGPPKPGNEPGQEPGQHPGDNPDDRLRAKEADPGVPPELAKLGVSAADWEKIKSMLKSDVGGAADVSVPEDYRGLVRKYFEQLAQQGKR